jgi:hypothetical protein
MAAGAAAAGLAAADVLVAAGVWVAAGVSVAIGAALADVECGACAGSYDAAAPNITAAANTQMTTPAMAGALDHHGVAVGVSFFDRPVLAFDRRGCATRDRFVFIRIGFLAGISSSLNHTFDVQSRTPHPQQSGCRGSMAGRV